MRISQQRSHSLMLMLMFFIPSHSAWLTPSVNQKQIQTVDYSTIHLHSSWLSEENNLKSFSNHWLTLTNPFVALNNFASRCWDARMCYFISAQFWAGYKPKASWPDNLGLNNQIINNQTNYTFEANFPITQSLQKLATQPPSLSTIIYQLKTKLNTHLVYV